MRIGVAKHATSPEALRHKREYDTKYQDTPERVNYREELNRERHKRGVYGRGGKDMSHTKRGTLVPEDPHTNRARHFKGRGTLKSVAVVKNHDDDDEKRPFHDPHSIEYQDKIFLPPSYLDEDENPPTALSHADLADAINEFDEFVPHELNPYRVELNRRMREAMDLHGEDKMISQAEAAGVGVYDPFESADAETLSRLLGMGESPNMAMSPKVKDEIRQQLLELMPGPYGSKFQEHYKSDGRFIPSELLKAAPSSRRAMSGDILVKYAQVAAPLAAGAAGGGAAAAGGGAAAGGAAGGVGLLSRLGSLFGMGGRGAGAAAKPPSPFALPAAAPPTPELHTGPQWHPSSPAPMRPAPNAMAGYQSPISPPPPTVDASLYKPEMWGPKPSPPPQPTAPPVAVEATPAPPVAVEPTPTTQPMAPAEPVTPKERLTGQALQGLGQGVGAGFAGGVVSRIGQPPPPGVSEQAQEAANVNQVQQRALSQTGTGQASVPAGQVATGEPMALAWRMLKAHRQSEEWETDEDELDPMELGDYGLTEEGPSHGMGLGREDEWGDPEGEPHAQSMDDLLQELAELAFAFESAQEHPPSVSRPPQEAPEGEAEDVTPADIPVLPPRDRVRVRSPDDENQ